MKLARVIYHKNMYCSYKEIDETFTLPDNLMPYQAREKAERLQKEETRKNTKWEVLQC